MKGLSFIDLQEQILQGQAGHYTSREESGVQTALIEAAKGELGLWHKTIQLPGILVDHLKIDAPGPIVIQTLEHMPSAVNLSFTLQGSSESVFEDLAHPIRNDQQKHNLLYLANAAGHHTLKPGRHIENIHIAFQPEYFRNMTGTDEATFAGLKDSMEKKRSALFTPDHGLIDLRIQQTLSDICNCVMTGSIKRLYLEAKLMELLALQVDALGSTTRAQDPAENELFREIKAYLTAHYLEEITLNSVCRHFGINEFKLKRGFQQHFRTSVIRYLTSLRMQQARQLLESGQCTIQQVTDLLNYSHANHFSIAFKKYFGIVPSQISRVKKVY
ncbi:helix-turn-helix transcriptional regulator [Pontibacter sp. Tf4]|uniref:helix-turn-helix transcriptional regulator n=1 Tax=Pontibacter sp. Tf4 TaxID=2761620 RepID=UPI00162785BE|nr:AraC family transcriptional regulator [Pontibacter sp. Tf4]MBB6612664.1 helix-turn-helix transcriptional regulator [Pontibacter sp. Tf4]